MKKLLLLAVCGIIGLQTSSAQSQVIEDFENWNSYSIGFLGAVQMEEPVGWSCTDSFIVGIGKSIPSFNTYQAQLTEESPGNSGTSAMKAATKLQGALSIPTVFSLPSKNYPAIVSNSIFGLDIANFAFGQTGGTSISFSPAITSMYVKSNIVGGDSTFITAQLLAQGNGAIDTIIATADTILSSNITSFTQISLPFNYVISNQTPNLIRYTISSGNPLAILDTTGTFSVNAGTEIIVDDIEISGATGIRQLMNASPIAKVYPTTGGDVLYVDLYKQKKNVQFEIFGMNGQLLMSEKLNSNTTKISVSNLTKGIYIFSLKADGLIYQTGKFER